MGAVTFERVAGGPNAEEAFRRAVEEAERFNGIGGYTGTIAEKSSYTVIDDEALSGLSREERMQYARDLISEADPRVDAKWGPAGAIKLEDGGEEWLFFGWASS